MIDVHFLNEFKIYHVYVHANVDLKLVEREAWVSLEGVENFYLRKIIYW